MGSLLAAPYPSYRDTTERRRSSFQSAQMRQSGAVRRYYNPELTPEQMDDLDWENYVVVASVQAALGNITADIRAIFVAAPRGTAVLHFVVAEGCEEACAEDIDDTLSELEALLLGAPDYQSLSREVHVEEIPKDWTSRRWRGIYWSKGWSAWTDAEDK